MTSEVKDAKPEENKANKSGIPKAVFVEDVHVYMQQAENESAEVVLRRLDEQHQKYKFMEQNLNLKKKRLKVQLPELKGALNAIMHLEEKDTETIDTQFMLADNLYVKAKIPQQGKLVCG
ncbi:VBP1 [Bugula neritina]|uniref:VBP1 n=1 Tax=Bugula neritina TaxID=10212 RepID=A0A7J7KBP6_BUGNE|nr:VBP1 [Bugula neritina]